MKTKTFKTLSAITLLATLSACSSGGGSAAPSSDPKPQGQITQPAKPSKPQQKPSNVTKPQGNHQGEAQQGNKPEVTPKPPMVSQPNKPEAMPQPPMAGKPNKPEAMPQPPMAGKPNKPEAMPKPPMTQKPPLPAKPVSPYDKYARGLENQKDKLKLNLVKFTHDTDTNDKYPTDIKNVTLDLNVEKGSTNSGYSNFHIAEPDGDYYLVSLDSFTDGYSGYYYESTTINGNKVMSPRFVMTVRDDLVMNAPTNLNAHYKENAGFKYKSLKADEQKKPINGVFNDDIEIVFKDGKVDESLSKVTEDYKNDNLIFNIKGDVNKLTFVAAGATNRPFQKGETGVASGKDLLFIKDKDPSKKDPKYMMGIVKGNTFEGVFDAERQDKKINK